jgi:hypothetical protein
LVGKPERNRPIERTRCGLEDKNVSWRTMMQCYKLALDRGPLPACWQHGNECSGCTKYWKILKQLSDWLLFKKGSVLCCSCRKHQVIHYSSEMDYFKSTNYILFSLLSQRTVKCVQKTRCICFSSCISLYK